MPLQCSECSREFSIKSNLTRHLRMVHNIEVERIDILPGDYDTYHYKCLEGCNISFKYNRDLRKHLHNQHEINVLELNLDFPNSEEFNKWLHNEEANNHVQYVHLTATKRKTMGTETYYYECSRTGKRICVDDTVRKRRARKLMSKLNRGCTSQIIANKAHDGSYSVNYFKTHYGHEISLEHVKLSKQDRGAIASKLLLGLPVSTVLHSAKNTSGDNLKRINLLGRKDIVNIRKAFNIDLKDGKLVNVDAINVNLFLEECSSHEYNPVLYCNIQEFPQNEEICFILMSEYQSEVLREVGSNIVVINSTCLNNCDFELITLFVIAKNGESFPAACMFTNKIHFGTYELFFNKIKERVGDITLAIIVTNCDEMYYQAWKSVMAEVPCNIYNPVQVDVDWKLNLNRVVCSEAEVTRIKRKWLYETMKSLQNNKHETDFMENFEATLKVLGNDADFNDFLQYFLKNYSDLKKWADCYKIGLDLPTEQLEVISDVLKQYLNEEVEVRFDKIFHSLVRFIRDETVNSKLKNKTNRVFFVNENDARHRLLMDKNFNGVLLGENLWNVTEENAFGATHVVQKYLEKKCCNLICTNCNICLHCFSCSCVDFFIGNAICVHIHYIWVTYFQSIKQECNDVKELNCDEEIIIEVDQNQEIEEVTDNIDILRNEIVDRTTLLCSNVNSIDNKNALKIILDTLNQLCNISAISDQTEANPVEDESPEKYTLSDHSYL